MTDEKALEALVNYDVTVSLGGKSYSMRRVNLADSITLERYRDKLRAEGEVNANIVGVRSSLFLLCTLTDPSLKLDPEKMAKEIPLLSAEDIGTALEAVGFRKPQPKVVEVEKKNPTGA